MRALLSQNDTVDALAGVEKKPESMTDAKWQRMDRKAVNTIELCLADEVLSNTMGETTTAEL